MKPLDGRENGQALRILKICVKKRNSCNQALMRTYQEKHTGACVTIITRGGRSEYTLRGPLDYVLSAAI